MPLCFGTPLNHLINTQDRHVHWTQFFEHNLAKEEKKKKREIVGPPVRWGIFIFLFICPPSLDCRDILNFGVPSIRLVKLVLFLLRRAWKFYIFVLYNFQYKCFVTDLIVKFSDSYA